MEEEDFDDQNHEDDLDRLSNLPEKILLEILLRMETHFAIRTSALSKRWRYLWTALPNLDLDRISFMIAFKNPQASNFREYALQVLSNRDQSITCCKLYLYDYNSTDLFRQRVIELIALHGPENVDIDFGGGLDHLSPLFTCQHLKTLSHVSFKASILPTTPFRFVYLTNLKLKGWSIFDGDEVVDPFRDCHNLKNLELDCCYCYANIFSISAPQLATLTLSNMIYRITEAPDCIELLLRSSKLTSVNLKSSGFLPFSIVVLPCKGHVNLRTYVTFPRRIVDSMEMDLEAYHGRKYALLTVFQGFQTVNFLIEPSNSMKVIAGNVSLKFPPFSRIEHLIESGVDSSSRRISKKVFKRILENRETTTAFRNRPKVVFWWH